MLWSICGLDVSTDNVGFYPQTLLCLNKNHSTVVTPILYKIVIIIIINVSYKMCIIIWNIYMCVIIILLLKHLLWPCTCSWAKVATEHFRFLFCLTGCVLERLTVRNPTFCLWILSSLFTYLLPKYSASHKTYVIKESLDEAW